MKRVRVNSMGAEEIFRYKAFISYSHKDMRIACKVQRFLTRFRIPRKARKKLGVKSSRLGKIFRDATHMRATELNTAIKEGLAASEYLLVICSPNAVADNEDGYNWVNEEIKEFVSMAPHRSKHLVPAVFCHAGETRANKCLPTALLPYCPYYLEVEKFGFTGAMVRAAASLMGQNVDEFWDWYAEERFIRNLLIAFFLLILSSFVAFGVWWYETPHERYFADYVECENIPVGLRELSAEERATTYQHYCLTKQRNRLVSVRRCTASGIVTPDLLDLGEERPCEMRLDYSSETGRAERQTYYDENGKIVQVREFPDDKTILFLTPPNKEDLGQMAMGMNYKEQDGLGHMVERMRVERENGFIMQETYTDARGDALPNEEGVYGVRYKRDNEGRVVRTEQLSEHGELRSDSRGVAVTCYTYNTRGQLARVAYLGEDESPVRANTGACSTFVKWEAGNPVAVYYWDEKEKACRNSNGVAAYSWTYQNGHRRFEICRDEEGKPCFSSDSVSVTEMVYNEKGQMKTKIHRDPAGALCYDVNGVAYYLYGYDENNRCVSRTSCDSAGKRVNSKNGYAVWRLLGEDELKKYHKSGSAFSYEGEIYYDENGNYAYPNEKTPIVYYENDNRGRLCRIEFLDENGKLIKNCDGVAAVNYEYDKYNHRTRVLRYNENNDLLPTHIDPWNKRIDVAEWRLKWNAAGLPAVVTTYNEEGIPYNHFYGENVVEKRIKYERNVRFVKDDGKADIYDVVEISYYDGSGDGTMLSESWYTGSAVFRVYYDKRGDIVIKEWYDENRQPMISTKEGVFRAVAEYDVCHRRVSERYYDTEGNPCSGKEGAYRIEWKYDSYGHQTEVRFYGKDGNLCMNEEAGFAIGVSRHDYAGRILEEKLFDTEENLCLGRDGWAICRREYDPQGNKIAESYWADENTPVRSATHLCHLIKWKHNNRGATTETKLYGDRGELMDIPGIPPVVCRRLDSRDRDIEISYFDANEQPTMLPVGYFRVKQEFDNNGNIVEQIRYDADNKVVFCLSERLRQESEYEEVFSMLSDGFPDKSEKEIIGLMRILVRKVIAEEDKKNLNQWKQQTGHDVEELQNRS